MPNGLPSSRRYAEWTAAAGRRFPAAIIGVLAGGVSVVVVGLVLGVLASLLPAEMSETFRSLLEKAGFLIVLAVAGFTARKTVGYVNEKRAAGLRDVLDESQFSVSIKLRREVVYGFDEGLLSFTDGWLIYVGRQCSFSVRKEDVESFLSDQKTIRFHFPGPHNQHVVEMQGESASGLWREFSKWKLGLEVEGEPIFPPVGTEPSPTRIAKFWIGCGLLLVLVAAVALIHPTANRCAVAFLAGLGGVSLVGYGEGMRKPYGAFPRTFLFETVLSSERRTINSNPMRPIAAGR